MNPAAARQLLSIEPTVVLNAARRPKKEQRRRSAKTSGGNPVHQKKGACEVPHEVGYVCGRGARIELGERGARKEGGAERGGRTTVGGSVQRRGNVAGALTTAAEEEEMETRPLVVFVSTEVAPWSKVGGPGGCGCGIAKGVGGECGI